MYWSDSANEMTRSGEDNISSNGDESRHEDRPGESVTTLPWTEQLLGALGQIPTPLAYSNAEGQFVFTNLAYRRALGMGPDDTVDDSVSAEALLGEVFDIDASECFGQVMRGYPINRVARRRRKVTPRDELSSDEVRLSLEPHIPEEGIVVGVSHQIGAQPGPGAAGRVIPLELNELPVGVWYFDHSVAESQVSDKWLTQMGYSREDVGDQSMPTFWSSLIHPDDLDRILLARQRSPTLLIDYRMLFADGQYRWMRSIARVMETGFSGDVRQSVGVMFDFEEEKRSRLDVERALGQANRLLDSTEEAHLGLDRHGRVHTANATAAAFLGLSLADMLGKGLPELLTLDRHERETASLFDSMLHREQGILPDETLISTDGSHHQVSISYKPVHDTQLEYVGTVVTIQDLERQQRVFALRDRNERLRALGQLASGIAHDFNNLLNMVRGASDVLQHSNVEALDPAGNECVELIKTACGQAADLTGKLLAFDPSPTSAFEPLDLHESIEATASILELTLDKRSTVEVNLGADHHLVSGNRTALESALLNLGINAQQAIEVRGTISFETRDRSLSGEEEVARLFDLAAGRYCSLTVTDSGEGIAPEVIDQVFEPFYSNRRSGTGLGLAAVFGTVLEHAGGISVSSKLGIGSTFEILLPTTSPDLAPTSVPPVPEQPSSTTPRRVLLADDDEGVRRVTQLMLESIGHQVVSTADGAAAVRHFDEHADEIDLVILDQGMPELNGLEALTQIRARRSDVPVVIASGFVSPSAETELRRAGANEILRKPFSIAELRSAADTRFSD